MTSTARPGEAARPIAVDGGQVAEFLMGLPPEWLVPLGAPVWWLNLNLDRPANACLDSALVLREACAQLGVAAEPKVVVLHAHDGVTGREYVFGTERGPGSTAASWSATWGCGCPPPVGSSTRRRSSSTRWPVRAGCRSWCGGRLGRRGAGVCQPSAGAGWC